MEIKLSNKYYVDSLTYYTGTGGHPVSFLYAQDINHDGIDEIFFAGFESQPTTPSTYDNTSVVIFGWHEGVFQNITNDWLPGDISQVQGVGDISFGDFDGNGNLDVFLSAYTDMNHPASRYALMNTGSSFERIDLGVGLWDHASYSADINQDGYADVFLTGYNLRSNFIGSSMGLIKVDSGINGSGLALGDYLNNGTVTMIVSDSSNVLAQLFSIRIDDNQVIYEWISDLPPPRINFNSHDIRVRNVDFDEDGLLDVLVFSWQFPSPDWDSIKSEIQFLKNLGDGEFEDVTDQVLVNYDSQGNVSYFPQILDVNGDGLLDIFTSNRDWLSEYRSTSLLIHQANGLFVPVGTDELRNAIGTGAQAVLAKGPGGDYYLISEGAWQFSTVSAPIYISKVSFTTDEVSPTVLVGFSDDNTSEDQIFRVTFTLSEFSENFEAIDIKVSGGILSEFVGFGMSYSANFKFDDSSEINFSNQDQLIIAGMYAAFFNRTPDASGFDYWVQKFTNGALTLNQIADYFYHLPEGQAVYGASNHVKNIELVYQNVFNRDGDVDGLNFWANKVSESNSFSNVVNEMINFVTWAARFLGNEDGLRFLNMQKVGVAYALKFSDLIDQQMINPFSYLTADADSIDAALSAACHNLSFINAVGYEDQLNLPDSIRYRFGSISVDNNSFTDVAENYNLGVINSSSLVIIIKEMVPSSSELLLDLESQIKIIGVNEDFGSFV